MLRVTRTAALAVITLARHRRHDVRARGRRHPVVPRGSGDVWNRPESVHAEQAEQQSTYEQPTEPHRRSRSSELSEAGHGLIVGMDQRPLASPRPHSTPSSTYRSTFPQAASS